ncbi:MAG: response regulator [Desulfocapsa sp.]|nr:response regulator [Desulfocapsa sp.]
MTQQSLPEDLNLSILIVEDNLTNQEVTSGMLSVFGCQTELANNGQEAVQAFSPGKYDLILMDCQMPVMDGYQATAAIRQLERDQGVSHPTPIIALTGLVLKSDWEKCLNVGMNGYLSKPFSLQKLLEAVIPWSRPRNDDRLDPSPPQKGQSALASIDRVGASAEKSRSPSIDRAVLHSLTALQAEGQEDIVARIIHAYIAGSDVIIARLREAFGSQDRQSLGNAAHALKSSSANVGAIALSEMSKDIEMQCKEDILVYDDQLMSRIESEFSVVKKFLQKEVVSYES